MAEEGGRQEMTFSQAFKGADAAEVTRRHAVCVRLNKLWDKAQGADADTRKKVDREIKRIRREESFWLKEAAYFLYT